MTTRDKTYRHPYINKYTNGAAACYYLDQFLRLDI